MSFEAYNEIEVKQREKKEFATLERGKCSVCVTDYKIKLKEDETVRCFSFMWTITEGVQSKRTFWTNYYDNEVGEQIFKKTMNDLGIEKKAYDSWDDFLSKAIGKEVEGYLAVKVDGQYTNYNFYIDEATTATSELKNHAPTIDEDDSIPF